MGQTIVKHLKGEGEYWHFYNFWIRRSVNNKVVSIRLQASLRKARYCCEGRRSAVTHLPGRAPESLPQWPGWIPPRVVSPRSRSSGAETKTKA